MGLDRRRQVLSRPAARPRRSGLVRMVLLALQALLGRDFDKVMVVSEERSPKCARLGQLRLICRSKLPFLIQYPEPSESANSWRFCDYTRSKG